MPRVQWTVEQCREMGRKSAARTNALKAQRKAAAALAALNPPPNPAATLADSPNAYVSARLARVRKQLDKLDSMIEAETDPQKLDRLAAAQERLSRQEHDLAGRPHAGNLRPTARQSPPRPSSPPFDPAA